LSVAETSVVLKHFPGANPYATNAVAMAVGSAMLFAFSIAARESWVIPSRPATFDTLFYLALPGSVLLFGLYLFVISKWTASQTNYGFVLVPIVTVVIASLLVGEGVTVTFVAGTALALIGVYAAALSGTAQKPT
jgi:drug/metabolite transporter (DMT)-like permease